LTFRVGADRGGTSGHWYSGYLPSFAFLDGAELAWRDGVPELYLHIFHPRSDDFSPGALCGGRDPGFKPQLEKALTQKA
jgi:hypothetical protein